MLPGLLVAGAAAAAVITSAILTPNHQASRLVLTANAPLEYQVELADPQTVVLHFLNASLQAPLPDAGGDRLVASLSARPEPGGLAITVRTRFPGVTVLPLYEAQARRLTLELGGPPTLEEKVAPPKASPPAAQPAQPSPAPAPLKTPAPQSAPSALARQADPTPPAQAQRQAPAAQLQAPAAASQAAAPQGPPPVVLRVRLGSHAEFTRLVLDADAGLKGVLFNQGPEAVLSLERAKIAPGLALPRGDERVDGLRVEQGQPLKLRFKLARPLASHQLYPAGQGDKLVLDLRLITPQAWAMQKAARQPAAPAAPGAPPAPAQTEAQAKAEAEALDRIDQARVVSPQELKVSPELPVMEPNQAPPAPPEPAGDGQALAEAAPPAAGEPAKASLGPDAPSAPAPPAPAATREISERFPEIPMASPAEPGAGETLARGKIPPVPPPPALARPRGDINQGPAEAPPESAHAVIGKVAQAQAQKAAKGVIPQAPPQTDQAPAEPAPAPGQPAGQPPTTALAPMPGPPETRPPQAARLGEKGQMDREAQSLFNRAKLELDSRNYAEALNGFQKFLLNYPKHPLAGEATFRLADSYFYLHEREMLPHYPQAMENYQKGIDLYPKSDQVPWALLQMGRTAMLAGEAFKAQGYFQIVMEDYPKSEYVPLAMVNQGRAYVAEGKWPQALDQFREVAAKFADSRFRKDADWGQAQALFGMAQFERASYLLQDMDRRFPKLRLEEPELLYYIGEAEFQLKRYPEARRYFLWALNIMPDIRDNDIILTRVGDTYQFEGAFKAAKVIYNQVVKLFPDTDGALVARIRLAESPAKDKDHPWDIFQVAPTTDALKTYNEILKKYPTRPVAELAQLKLGVYYYKKEDYPRALAILEQLLQKNPRSPFRPEVEYTLDMATVAFLQKLKKDNKPIALMDAYLRNRASLRRPNSNQMLEILAWAYENTGLNLRAAKLYQVLISRGLDRLDYHVGLARNLMTGRDYQGVLAALPTEVVAKLDKEAAVQGRSLRGRSLAALGQCKEAEPLLRFVLEQKFEYPWVAQDYAALGRCLVKLDKAAEGLEALDQAGRRFDPGDRLERYLVAMEAGSAARRVGQTERSLAYFKDAEGLAGDDRARAQAIYEQAASLRALKRNAEVAAAYQRLVKLKAEPWTGMAKRHLEDMKLAPRLATVGTGPLNEEP